MKIKANDMKSCFTCRNLDAFVIPDCGRYRNEDIKVDCARITDDYQPLAIDGDCLGWEKKG